MRTNNPSPHSNSRVADPGTGVIASGAANSIRDNSKTPSSRLLIFAKAPLPGTVKTRLAEALGASEACRAYRLLVETLLDNLAGTPNVELCYAPRDAGAEIQEWVRPGWRSYPQCEGDLGARLSEAFDRAFRSGSRRVMAIGSDCPYVTEADIETARKALEKADIVLGPATDGGYWLIGLSQPRPALFEEMPWSTDRLFKATAEKARQAGLKTHLLRELEDVDTVAEWRKFLAR